MNPALLRRSLFAAAFCCAVLILSLAVVAQDKDWRPVTEKELGMKTGSVEPDADAEVLFWDVRVDDSNPETMVMKHYVRVKIFTDRGREKYSKIDIPFIKGERIKDIQARVIKQDGSIVDVAKADVFDREIAKTDKIKVKAKSFAVPNIEPGVIVEYRYSEVYQNGTANNMRMEFQQEVPIENIAYYFKPYESTAYLTFNMQDNKFVKDKNGFYKAAMENVPSIKAEPQMPPEDEVRSWLLLYYNPAENKSSSDFWSHAGYYLSKSWEIKDTLKPGKDLKDAATEIVAGANSDVEKMEKLYTFCKTKVKNITYDTSLTEDQKDDIKPNKSSLDTYKKLQGTDTEINELFASLASALGYEARLAFGGDRSKKFFDPTQAHVSFIHFSAIAVNINGRWKYFSPGDIFVPFGMLSWNEEDTSVLLLNNKDYITTKTPYSTPDQSVAKRSGKFKLSDDGTLEGTVRIEYTGQLANTYKLDNYKQDANKREETLKDVIKAHMSTAEISDIAVDNVTDPQAPFTYRFHVKVPGYAQKTGKRLFLQPGIFEYGEQPVFSASTRKYDIFFHFPWSEQDDIEIELPKGFALDSADAPMPLADPERVGVDNIEMNIDQTNNVLKYKRRFSFGGGGNTIFPATAYVPLKKMFDAFNKADSHTLTLKQN